MAPMAPETQAAWDLVAIVSAVVSAVFTYTRRHMLSRLLASWHDAPGWVQAALVVQSGWMGCVALSVVFDRSAHATPREALSYVAGAAVSVIVAFNLGRSGRRDDVAVAQAAGVNGSAVKAQVDPPADRSFAPRREPQPPAH